jgi:hypothetical protein
MTLCLWLQRLVASRAIDLPSFLGNSSASGSRCSLTFAGCPYFFTDIFGVKERDGPFKHQAMTLDLTSRLSLLSSRSSTREALIVSVIPRSYRWIHKPLVPVARVLPPLWIKKLIADSST